jgi:hypothetical protein
MHPIIQSRTRLLLVMGPWTRDSNMFTFDWTYLFEINIKSTERRKIAKQKMKKKHIWEICYAL